MSPVARLGLALGVVLGLVPVLALGAPDLTSDTLVFLAMILGLALLPYVVFLGAEDEWSRPLAISVLATLFTLHAVATISIVDALDEDALSSLAFLTVPPVLAGGVAVVAACVRLSRAARRRRG